jgi:hypothetical protein
MRQQARHGRLRRSRRKQTQEQRWEVEVRTPSFITLFPDPISVGVEELTSIVQIHVRARYARHGIQVYALQVRLSPLQVKVTLTEISVDKVPVHVVYVTPMYELHVRPILTSYTHVKICGALLMLMLAPCKRLD